MSRLLVIDALSLLYRAFHAIPSLSTRSGQPTNAVYGFIRMLRLMTARWTPTHLAVAFDGGSPPERMAILEQYKAQRPPMPEPLRSQLPLAEDYLDRAGVRWVRQSQCEADDIIASMTAWAEGQGAEVFIATGDKDLFQLVSERVRVISGSGDREMVMGPDEVRRKTGVPPARIPEWLALVGDASDNIPGVPGVGPKTAARLLDRCDSLQALDRCVAGADSDRIGRALTEHWDRVQRNLMLVTLRRDLPVPFGWADLQVRPPEVSRLLPFFEALEFGALAREIRQAELPV